MQVRLALVVTIYIKICLLRSIIVHSNIINAHNRAAQNFKMVYHSVRSLTYIYFVT